MSKKLAIVMPVWNNWHYTKRAIQMLSKLPKDHLLIIVDNGSYDETKNLQCTDGLHIIKHDENLGFAVACNNGYRYAKEEGFEYVMFLNNDIKVMKDQETWTQPLLGAASDGSMVGPTVGCLDSNLNFICEAKKFPSAGYGYLSGWNLTAKTETWENLTKENEIGPFSTNFFAYFEDTDLSFRAMQQGIEFKVVNVSVKHFGRATGKKLGLSVVFSQSKAKFLELWKGHTEEFLLKKD